MKNNLMAFALLVTGFCKAQTAAEFDSLATKKSNAKDYQYALALIDKAIALDSKNQWYQLNKADIEFHISGPLEALKPVKAAIAINRKVAEPYNRAGVYYESAGIIDSAVAMYNKAIEFAESDSLKIAYMINRGVAKGHERDFAGAVIDFEKALDFAPNNIAALNNIAPCYRELGKIDRCVQSLQKIIKIDPKFVGSYVNLGFLYSSLDSLDLALSYFNKAAEIAPEDPLVYNNRGYVYYKKAEYTKSFADINKSLKIYPTNSYAYRNLGLLYIAMNMKSEACTALSFARDYGFERQYGNEVTELIEKNCKN